MIMSDKIYKIAEFFNSASLISRQAAKKLCEEVAKLKENTVILDFKNIDFASRSFFDQLNSEMGSLRLANKQVELINLNKNLSELLKLVKKAARSDFHITYTNVGKAETISFF